MLDGQPNLLANPTDIEFIDEILSSDKSLGKGSTASNLSYQFKKGYFLERAQDLEKALEQYE